MDSKRGRKDSNVRYTERNCVILCIDFYILLLFPKKSDPSAIPHIGKCKAINDLCAMVKGLNLQFFALVFNDNNTTNKSNNHRTSIDDSLASLSLKHGSKSVLTSHNNEGVGIGVQKDSNCDKYDLYELMSDENNYITILTRDSNKTLNVLNDIEKFAQSVMGNTDFHIEMTDCDMNHLAVIDTIVSEFGKIVCVCVFFFF